MIGDGGPRRTRRRSSRRAPGATSPRIDEDPDKLLTAAGTRHIEWRKISDIEGRSRMNNIRIVSSVNSLRQ